MVHDDNDVTILPIPRIQCSNSYYHSNTSSSNISFDENAQMAEQIALKYLGKYQLGTEGNTQPPSVIIRDTEVSMATRQYLQRHGLDDSSTNKKKPHKSPSSSSYHSDNNNLVLDIERLRSLPKL